MLHITHLFNAIANQGCIPKQFRVGLLIPILKGPAKTTKTQAIIVVYRFSPILSNSLKN